MLSATNVDLKELAIPGTVTSRLGKSLQTDLIFFKFVTKLIDLRGLSIKKTYSMTCLQYWLFSNAQLSLGIEEKFISSDIKGEMPYLKKQ